ncbi:MAG TPA: hypothetical protein VN734_00225 [Acidobacteriaceae bacterium]|nr:hypothetical protein [Acidobacteriaceae bacterium]
MAKLTIGFGVLLGLIGAGYFVATGSAHPTALIPAWFGLALIIFGALAVTENARRRMLWMHIAVTIALLGFLFPGFMAIKEWMAARGGPLTHPAAVQEQAVMSLVCLILTALCVRSFIAARRSRTA